MKFLKWVKENSKVNPPEKIDSIIINYAKSNLVKRSYKNQIFVFTSLALVIFMVVKINQNHENNKKISIIDEPIELIENYQYIELMADASNLNAQDWERLK